VDAPPGPTTWPPPGPPRAPLAWPPPGTPPPFAPPPARAPTFFERLPGRRVAFGAVLFLFGWLGILFQRDVLRQLVVGAPLFEEMAKFGLALVFVGFLRVGPTGLRMPFAWASGAGFGVLEHFLTYADEPTLFWGLRVAFHAATAGLSMAIFGLLEPLADVRVRWATTLTSSAFHAANNLGALVLEILSLAVDTSVVAVGFSSLVTLAVVALTVRILLSRDEAQAFAVRLLRRMFTTLSVEPAPSPPPRGAWPPADPPGP
jgi:hypothetical protein